MIRRPPRTTRTDTLFPYSALFRSAVGDDADVQLVSPGDAIDLVLHRAGICIDQYFGHRHGHARITAERQVVRRACRRVCRSAGSGRGLAWRSEERRVGEGVVGTCRSRWAPVA